MRGLLKTKKTKGADGRAVGSIEGVRHSELASEPRRRAVRRTKQPKNLTGLFEKKDWGTVRSLISESEGSLTDEECFRLIEATEDYTGANALHEVCRHHPPLDIVETVASLCPDLAFCTDMAGRTPLHIAAGLGASPQVVGFLIEVNVQAAGAKEANGKTPLHMACENLSDVSGKGIHRSRVTVLADTGSESGGLIHGPTPDVIRYLCEASPRTAADRDVDRMNALDYVKRDENADEKVIKILKKAIDKAKRARDERGGVRVGDGAKKKAPSDLKAPIVTKKGGTFDEELLAARFLELMSGAAPEDSTSFEKPRTKKKTSQPKVRKQGKVSSPPPSHNTVTRIPFESIEFALRRDSRGSVSDLSLGSVGPFGDVDDASVGSSPVEVAVR